MNMKPHQRTRVLLLGGTTEANVLAERLARDQRFDAVLSLAGRTSNPVASPLTARVGGFGGIEGLCAYLTATHPFAAIISSNAVAACHQTGTALIALERLPWIEAPSDTWHRFPSVSAAIAALPKIGINVFSGLGRLSLNELEAAPQHHWIVRVIDPLKNRLALPRLTVVTARGPFETVADIALFQQHGIEAVLAKNSGGSAAYSKIAAARALNLPVYLIDRPHIANRTPVATVEAVLELLVRHHERSVERGV
jgi:precorrin-6A/cobalt-precorrin-6A reductase